MSTGSASAAGPTGAPVPSVIARRSSPGAAELRQFLTLNGVVHRWIDPDSDPLVPLLGGAATLEGKRLPLVVFADGSELEPPQQYRDFHAGMDAVGARPYLETACWRAELAERLGLPTRPAREEYDVLIVGAGPAGLTAAVYAASEGLTTLVLERTAPGGQAGTSARIENYPGFPQGISGADLAAAIHEQALRFGAEILIGVEISQVKPGSPYDVRAAQRLRLSGTHRSRCSRSAVPPTGRPRHRTAGRLRRPLRLCPGRSANLPRRPGRNRRCGKFRRPGRDRPCPARGARHPSRPRRLARPRACRTT